MVFLLDNMFFAWYHFILWTLKERMVCSALGFNNSVPLQTSENLRITVLLSMNSCYMMRNCCCCGSAILNCFLGGIHRSNCEIPSVITLVSHRQDSETNGEIHRNTETAIHLIHIEYAKTYRAVSTIWNWWV